MRPSKESPTEPAWYKKHLGPLMLAVAGATALILWLTTPTPSRRPHREVFPLVTAVPLHAVDHPLQIELHGRVEPVAHVLIAPQVAGRIVWVHPDFVPGGHIPANTTILEVDRRDYLSALKAAEADLAVAREALRLEEGGRRAAEVAWSRFSQNTESQEGAQPGSEKDLATRGPQLRTRQAAVLRAEAALTQAKLDLERSRLSLPQAVVIESIAAAKGTLAQPGATLGKAYPAEKFFIRAAMPSDKLRWLTPGIKAPVQIWPKGLELPLQGFVRELVPSVEERGSLGQVLVELPISRRAGADGRVDLPARAGEFVRMRVTGAVVPEVFVVPRDAYHRDGEVWIVEDERLKIQPVKPIYGDAQVVVIKEGLRNGQRLITTQLSQPVTGMRVRVAADESKQPTVAETERD